MQNEDLVVWHTFGVRPEILITPFHYAKQKKVEDFPVMPVNTTTISCKPADFFNKNLAIDVEQIT